ncbi:mas-related G-protein coupled receptor member H-like [Lacerta agilis]|uniref:mas-related G-protein coupled receptor member H-like n=1 Tax=Lacerta agilis TaxID=80427 RepID=UPI001419C89A|nr:mas-related G-protein coupled receptor member H-like [Lacerta agilis]
MTRLTATRYSPHLEPGQTQAPDSAQLVLVAGEAEQTEVPQNQAPDLVQLMSKAEDPVQAETPRVLNIVQGTGKKAESKGTDFIMAELSTAVSLALTIDGVSGDYMPSAFPNEDDEFDLSSFTYYLLLFGCLFIFTLIAFLCGLVGNAIVIWFLCFIVKKNPITTYILNLAAADSCVLVTIALSVSATIWNVGGISPELGFGLFISAHDISLYLLTAISVEKCLSVAFPIWYRCHRLEHMSEIVCALIWAISILVFGIDHFFISTEYEDSNKMFSIIHMINSVFCPLVVLICTVILFIKVCCSLHRCQRGKFYTALLLTLLFFLIFGVPLSVTISVQYFLYDFKTIIMMALAVVCAVINSSVNPFIYFLIGRKKTHRSREPLKVVLERVFSDKADCREDRSPPATTDSMMMTP